VTEEQIIKGCLRKDVVCQRMLFQQYAGRLMTICLRYAGDKPEAEDMLQESFIKIFNALQQYRFQGSFEGWMKKLVVNTCLKILQRKRIMYPDISSLELISAPVHPHAISGLTEEELIKMIAELPEGYRIVFNLYVMEGFSHDEIAAMLNIETVTSRSQLIKARRMLQKQILSHQKIALSHDR
jgi:RNA polymerase sigma-70 factor (ECF subfamily)